MNPRKKDKLPIELFSLAEEIGKFIQYWGFKAIHGKIWTILFLSPEPLSAIELSRKLKVSKTLLSFSTAELLKYEVIQEVGKGIKRTIYFRANPDVAQVILNVLTIREQKRLTDIQSSFNSIKNKSEIESQIDATRAEKLGEMICAAREALQAILLPPHNDIYLIDRFLSVAAALTTHQKKN